MLRRRMSLGLAVVFILLGTWAGSAAAQEQSAPPRRPDVIYVPTHQDAVNAMLKLAAVTKDDVVYDLGCGDGRIPVTAARDFGARAVGVDIDPQRIAEARANVRANNVGDTVKILEGDLFQTPIGEATVVTLYLLPSLNEKLMPKLLSELKPGSRVVSHSFKMGASDWEPEQTVEVPCSDGITRTIYLWTIPSKK